MRMILGLVRAAHPEPGAAVTLVAAVLAVACHRGAVGVIIVAATIAASQFCIGWSNDAIDASRDAAVGRRGKPVASGEVSRRAVVVAAVLAGLAMLGLAALSGWIAGAVITLGLVSGLLYNWPLKGTAFSVVPYAVSFAALPAFVVLGRPGAPTPPWWLLAAGALLGSGAHFANALPDLVDDTRTGVRGLPHRLGPAGSRIAAAALLLAATAVLAFAPPGRGGWFGPLAFLAAAVVLPIGWYAERRVDGSRAAFRAVMVVALIDVGLFLAAGLSV